MSVCPRKAKVALGGFAVHRHDIANGDREPKVSRSRLHAGEVRIGGELRGIEYVGVVSNYVLHFDL